MIYKWMIYKAMRRRHLLMPESVRRRISRVRKALSANAQALDAASACMTGRYNQPRSIHASPADL